MEKIIKDAEMASRVVEGEEFFYHDKIYYSSNENLEELFKYIDVKDKDVLTVLASSDQYFYSCINGARSVDTFDKNILTKYYYYLRKWSIKYLGSIYPDKKLINNSRYIYELLELVECSSRDEELAKLFWNSYIRRIYPFDNNKLFFIGTRKHNLDKDTINTSEETLEMYYDKIKNNKIYVLLEDYYYESKLAELERNGFEIVEVINTYTRNKLRFLEKYDFVNLCTVKYVGGIHK